MGCLLVWFNVLWVGFGFGLVLGVCLVLALGGFCVMLFVWRFVFGFLDYYVVLLICGLGVLVGWVFWLVLCLLGSLDDLLHCFVVVLG